MDRRRWLLAVAAAIPSACSRKTPPAAPSKINVAATPYRAMSGLYLADELGLFSKEGLELSIQQIPSAAQIIPMLAAGKVDVAFSGLVPGLLNAISRGAWIRIVAGREFLTTECGDLGTFFYRRDRFPRGLDDLKALKGKRVAIGSRAGVSEFLLDALLASAGMSADDLRIPVLGTAEALAALSAGSVDAILSQATDKDPKTLSDRIARGPGAASLLPHFQYSFVVFGRSLLNGDPAVGVRFLRAWLRGSRAFLNGQTPKFLDDWARLNSLDPAIARNACRTTFTADGSIDHLSIQRFIDWAVRKKYCTEPLRAEAMADTRFIAAAQKEVL